MSDFFPTGPQIPSPPFEIPVPEVPQADFRQIGQQFEAGRQDISGPPDKKPGWFDWIYHLIAAIIGAFLGMFLAILARLLKFVFDALAGAEQGFSQVAGVVIRGMTGLPISDAIFASPTSREARAPAAASLVSAVQQALCAGGGNGAGGGLEPSSAGAERFLGMTTHLAIEGWLIGLICDAFSFHELEQVADLKESIEQALGFGRLARRALSPPMKICVEDPYTWLLNSIYRPALAAPELLVREYIRDNLDRDVLDKYMSWHGWSADNVQALINQNKQHLSPAEIATLYLHGAIQNATAMTLLKDQGYEQQMAQDALAAINYARYDEWNKLRVNEAIAGLRNHTISRLDVDSEINNSGLPADELDAIKKYANLVEKVSVKRFSIAEGEQLVEKGLWTLDQFRTLATSLGYSPQDELDLELLTLGKIVDKADAAAKKAAAAKARADAAAARAKAQAAKAAAAAAAAEAKGISIAREETLVLDGVKTMTDYATFLHAKGIAADNITALTEVLQTKLDNAAKVRAAHPGLTAGAKAKNVDLNQLETAVLDGVIPMAEFQTRLEGLGFSADDIQLLTETLQDRVNAAKTKADAKAEAAARAKSKNVNLAEEQRAVRQGLATVDQYRKFLDGLGFNPESRDLLVQEIQAQLAADQASRQTKASVAAALKQKGISLNQMEQAVRAGVSTIDDYRARLAQAGYSVEAQNQLIDLLQLRMQQDKQTLASKGHAAALVAQVGLSLVNLERAVKLGVIKIATYTDALKRAGVSDSDAQVLTLSLAASVKTTKQQMATVPGVSKELAAKGLDYKKLEADVLAGRISTAQLGGILAGAGILAADQQSILGLVSDEVANQKAVAELENRVNASAAAKGLSLGQEEAAVRAGVKTLADYQTFLTSLNYDQSDIETLVSTLETKLKSSKTAPAPVTIP